ncbi:nuclease domain-containing protein [Neobacillus niacini]|uniref:nuclease domain-containing protein n=1 Tax=Neobacillus niacini TaxID=86668 RepID=UPI0021CB3175|nr:nuclease domain-containing protein [Neobacillus niacini]MCM3768133.1 hypothetical protein [Neobacillus niacini]
MKLFHVIKEKNRLVVHEELQFNGKEYFTCEYNKIKKRMAQIGVSIDNASRVIVKQFENEVAQLTLDHESGIWYHNQKQWIEDSFKQTTDSIFGINAGGNFEVVAYDQFSDEFAKASVNITPGTMSIEEYQQMQQEVRRLFELFSYDLTKIDYQEENILKRIQLPFYPQQQFKNLFDQFLDCFYEITKMPEQELIQREKKVSLYQVKKWTPSVIIENEIKQNGKVTTTINEKTTEIKEHRMIRFMVEEFQQRIHMELAAEQKYLMSLQDELDQLEDVEKREMSPLAINFRNLIEIIKADSAKLAKRIDNWGKMSREIDGLLEHPILQCEPQLIEETHLFRMHPFYSEVFLLFIEYENLSPVLTESFRLFIQSILKSPTLYEIWVLLKIIEQFSQWGVNPYEFIQDVQEKYLEQKSISGYKKQFKLENRPFDIGLYYDYTFGENGYRPDFVIGIFDSSNRKWYMHTLDAKYKCYSKMKKGEPKILNDLEHSGTRYLNELFINDKRVLLKSGTLVHTDVSSLNWNVKHQSVNSNRVQHQIAHFYFTPNNNTNLEIFLKRMLHECSNFEFCCPKCGKKLDGTKEEKEPFGNKLRWKTTYICEECNEVWVANFCSSCSFNDRGLRNIIIQGRSYRYPRPLFKYPTNNFNLQVEDNWDVHCPTCNKTANHRINFITQDNIFKGTIILGKIP